MTIYEYPIEQRAILEKMQVPFGIYQFVDKRVVPLILSDGFCQLFEYDSRQEALFDLNQDMCGLIHPEDASRIGNETLCFAREGGHYEVVYRTKKKKDSSYHFFHAQGTQFFTDTGVLLVQVWYIDEGLVSNIVNDNHNPFACSFNRALQEENVIRAHYFDHLTGLPSMTYFFELVEAKSLAIQKEKGNLVLLYLDFTGMKYFNTKHGFSEGDKLLCAFSRLLIRTFSSENCCHVGADHFAVYTRQEGLEEVLRKLFAECRELNGGNSIPLHVGIYPGRLENIPVSEAFDKSKIACDTLRNTYGSCFQYYSRNLNEDEERRQHILSHLDEAIEKGWIQVYYQAIVRAVTGKVSDEEALARWIDPVMGFLSPGEFIPYLEDAGLIYKLDLCVLDQVLEKILQMEREGKFVVPHSINLSRSDFDNCDIVEEIRRRVDEAGVSRSKITIEITESILGGNLDFMKSQVERFQSLGFPVWMDDFGSGYSSLDVLQTIKFNLLKFDMSFMRKLEQGGSGKIVLTELMKLATSLGVDTICEGVETENQVRFLQEIGCSKLQGYFFSKPTPLKEILSSNGSWVKAGVENPQESGYYEMIGRLNLYDVSVVASEDEVAFQNIFNTLPMGIMEVMEGSVQFVRTNQSYREFMDRFFHYDISQQESQFTDAPPESGNSFMAMVKECSRTGNRMFLDEAMPDGYMVHSLVRRLGENPVNGRVAVAIAVLSITNGVGGTTYANIARALAQEYHTIYYVDLDSEQFIKYSSPWSGQQSPTESHGEHFFHLAQGEIREKLCREEQEQFLAEFSKEKVLREIDEKGAYHRTYRTTEKGAPRYVHMKIARTLPDCRHLIIGVSQIHKE